MHNIETIHHKTRVAAENVGFIFKAGFFKSVPMVISFKPLVSDSKPTSSNRYRSSKALVVMDNIDTFFHHMRIVAAETVGFRFEADLSK